MTTEEAIKIANKIQLSDNPLWSEIKLLAEKDEKRIAELEAQIEKMRSVLEQWYNQHSDKSYTKTFYEKLIKVTEGFLWSDVCVK